MQFRSRLPGQNKEQCRKMFYDTKERMLKILHKVSRFTEGIDRMERKKKTRMKVEFEDA